MTEEVKGRCLGRAVKGDTFNSSLAPANRSSAFHSRILKLLLLSNSFFCSSSKQQGLVTQVNRTDSNPSLQLDDDIMKQARHFGMQRMERLVRHGPYL
jgi:hypothetical protein